MQLLNDHLARNRANACVAELVKRKIDRSRLSASFRGRTGKLLTSFRPRPPSHSKVGDLRSGIEYMRVSFTVQPPALLSGPQDVTMSLRKATGDVRLRAGRRYRRDRAVGRGKRLPHMTIMLSHTSSTPRLRQ